MRNYFFLCFFVGCTRIIFGGIVEDGLRQISLSDRVNMKFFFDDAVEKNQAAHVIYFRNKPACLTGPVLKDKHKKFKETLCLKGWIAFKKNEHLFPHPNFIFSESIHANANFKVLDIYIVNKISLKKCVTENITIFKGILGEEFSAEQLITKLEEGISIDSLLNKDEMLIGLILGYGEESARAFKEVRSRCTQTSAPPLTEFYQKIEIKQHEGYKIGPVVFMGNPKSPQVKELVSAYEEELEEISKHYGNKKGSLKRILEKLCEVQKELE